jgi:hypothetical protein
LTPVYLGKTSAKKRLGYIGLLLSVRSFCPSRRHTCSSLRHTFKFCSDGVFHQERTGFDHHWTRILCIYSAGVCPFHLVASFKFGNHKSNVKSVERRGIKIITICAVSNFINTGKNFGGGVIWVFLIWKGIKGKKGTFTRYVDFYIAIPPAIQREGGIY